MDDIDSESDLIAVIRQIVAEPLDPAAVRLLALEIGRELGRHRWSMLRRVRDELDRAARRLGTAASPEAPALRGAAEALAGVCQEYEAEVLAKWRKLAERRPEAGTLQEKILGCLRRGPQLPSALARDLGVRRSQVSEELGLLRAHGFVEVDVPPVTADARHRPYRLTASAMMEAGDLPSPAEDRQPIGPLAAAEAGGE